MGANLSDQDICNQALDYLDEQPMTSITDTSTKAARLVRRNYPLIRDSVLRLHAWNFATTRRNLPLANYTPAFDWQYAYPIPGDVLRVLPLNYCGAYEGSPIPFVVEKHETQNVQVILTNQGGPTLKASLIMRVPEGMFDPLCCNWIAVRLARRLALGITGKASYLDRLMAEEKNAQREAEALNNSEGVQQRAVGDEWDNARFAPYQS